MNSYKKFGYYYDEVMSSINYELWIEFIEPYLTKNSKILDLACGSGTFCILLKLLGYDIDGLDLSSTILEIAKEKAKINHLDITFYNQNMIDFNTNKKYNIITCFFDSLNFLQDKQEFKKMIDNVYQNLLKDGYFIFDLFSKKMLKEYENNIFKEDYETFNILWKTERENEKLIHKIDITDGGEKIHEEYIETYFDFNDFITNKFEVIKIVGDFNDELLEDDEKILMILKKKEVI